MAVTVPITHYLKRFYLCGNSVSGQTHNAPKLYKIAILCGANSTFIQDRVEMAIRII